MCEIEGAVFPRLEKAKTGPVQGGAGIRIPNYIFPLAWHLRRVLLFSVICRIEMIRYIILFTLTKTNWTREMLNNDIFTAWIYSNG